MSIRLHQIYRVAFLFDEIFIIEFFLDNDIAWSEDKKFLA